MEFLQWIFKTRIFSSPPADVHTTRIPNHQLHLFQPSSSNLTLNPSISPYFPYILHPHNSNAKFSFIFMAGLFSHVLLFQKCNSQRFLISALPELKETETIDLDLIQLLAFPSDLKQGREMFYTFNVGKLHCSCWSFCPRKQDVQSAVVIVSQIFQPFLFDAVLQLASKCCRSRKITDPHNRQMMVYTSLSTREMLDGQKFAINLPNKRLVVEPDDADFLWMRDHNCSALGKNLDAVWNTVMTNGRVVFIGDDTELVSRAAVETVSLFSSIEFAERYATFSLEGDPRDDFLKQCHILATTDKSVNVSEFDLVVRVGKRSRGDFSKDADRLWEKTKTCFELMAGLWKIAIAYDPYFDILQRQIPFDAKNPEISVLSAPGFLARAQWTDTFMKIRKGMLSPERLRTSFLSIMPGQAVGKVKDSELEYAAQKVQGIMNNKLIKNDRQLKLVLQHHLDLLRARQELCNK